MLDEMDRVLHDSLCVMKRMLESSTIVCGGGAAESALSVHLEEYANTLDTREQLAVQEFADALLLRCNINLFPLVKNASSLEKNETFVISFSGSLYAVVIDFDESE